jgi:sec-independent protein translocase protein TatC
MAKTKSAKKPHDDLFEGTTMTFGEHLEELRVCLFRSVIGIALGCVVGFIIANNVVNFFQSPLERAMERYYVDKAITDYGAQIGEVTVEIRRMIIDEHIIPDSIQIEAGEIARSLESIYPETFSQLNLSPHRFTPGDFVPKGDLQEHGARSLARDLAAAGQNNDESPQRRMWELLTPEDRKVVEGLAAVESELSFEQTAQLAGVLNRLAGKRELHEAPELANITGPDADPTANWQSQVLAFFGYPMGGKADTVAALRKELVKKFDAEKSRRLNKLLIARVFPDSLRKARLNLLALRTWRPVKVRFQVLNAQEAFMIWMKAALVTGLVLASPYVFYQVWIFVAAGLYPHEKNYVYIYLPISVLLFFGGAALAFVFVFDPVLDFLFLFNKGMNADFDPRIGEWLGFVLILPIGFGLSFQLPLVMLFVNRIGLVSIETYIAQWRVAILTIFVVAMVLTPADPISMLLMAGPLCFLYLLGILMCKYMPRGRNPFAEAYEP